MISRLKLLAFVFIFVIALSLMPVFEVSAESTSPSLQNSSVGDESINAAQGEVLVKFKPHVSATSAQSDHDRIGAQEVGEIKKLGVQEVKLSPDINVDEAVANYRKMADVEYAEPNHIRRACVVPNDPYYTQQWGLSKIKAPEAWDTTTGSPNVIIAIVDTGVYQSHEDLAAKLIGSYDFETTNPSPDPDANDYFGHGTHVAGIAAALTNDNIGVAGVCWGAKILSVKALNKDGLGYDDDIARAIIFAADHGARVINLSLKGPDNSPTSADAVKYAHDHGCVVVAAAGNDANNAVNYPAAFPNVIAVSAIDSSGNLSSFSNFGSYIDVAAPGSNIFSTYSPLDYKHPGLYYYQTLDGTSMATPFVSGLAALVISKHPNWTADQVTRCIEETADNPGGPGRDDRFGYGIINAKRAVEQNIDSREEIDSYVNFYGNWNSSSSSYASGGQYKASSNINDSAQLNFYGTGVTWVAKKDPQSGIAEVYIDGIDQGGVDLYAPNDHWQALAFKKDGLQLGSHTIRIMVSGNKNPASSSTSININALDVFGMVDTTPPSAPTKLTAAGTPNNEGGSIDLAWSASTDNVGVVGYKVYRSTIAGGPYTLIADVSSTSYTDKTATLGTTFYYIVKAYDAAGNISVASNEASAASIDNLAPATPAGLSVKTGDRQATLSWSANTEPDLKGYNIHRSGLATATFVAASTTTYTDTGLTDGTTYSYQISAVDTSGNESAKCMAVSATPVDTTPPTPPGSPTALDRPNDEGGAINLSWVASTDNVGVTGYKIYRGTTSGIYTTSFSVGNVTSYTDTGLANGVTYYYRITALDAAGNESPYSVEVSAAPIDNLAPASPAGLTAAAGESQLTLSWIANTDPDLKGYNVYRDGIKLNTALVTTAGYTDSGLTDGTTYSYQISAVDTSGNESAKCMAVSATPVDTTPPTPPGFVSAVASGPYTIDLSWGGAFDNIGVTSYLVKRSMDQISFYPLAWVFSTSFTDTGLSRRATYYYQILASDAKGNISFPSAVACAKTSSRSIVRAYRSSRRIRRHRRMRSAVSRSRRSRSHVSRGGRGRSKGRRRSRQR